MIHFLRGKVTFSGQGEVILDVNGVGYQVFVPDELSARLSGSKGEEVHIFTHLVMKDDAMSLYGFLDHESLLVFKALLNVAGVGPKVALKILSSLGPRDILEDIAQGNQSRLRGVHGVGKKTAARICLDLKERSTELMAYLGHASDYSSTHTKDAGQNFEDAVSALVNLGYREPAARRAVESMVSEHGESLDSLIKNALKLLAKTG